ncbi:MAG: Gx transporter family protein [Firmicutes bacterium]|nr:Gx transporter family protein [Bacillota bacterium]
MADIKAFSSTRKLTTCALLSALALIFSYIEFLLPLSLGVPGIKIGLANIVVVLALYSLGAGYALAVNLIRIALSALLFGNLFSAVYALCGALFSLAVMLLLKKPDIFSLTGVSMAGGAAHNIAQLAAAAVIAGSAKVFIYLPVLVLAGAAAGIFNGAVCTLVLRKIK